MLDSYLCSWRLIQGLPCLPLWTCDSVSHGFYSYESKCFSFRQDACEALLKELKLRVQHGAVNHTEGTTAEDGEDLSPASVLVVDGITLEWALQEERKGDFLELSCSCRAVICCRSTPLQKSQVVRFIRDKLGVMTLAVGKYMFLMEPLLVLLHISLISMMLSMLEKLWHMLVNKGWEKGFMVCKFAFIC